MVQYHKANIEKIIGGKATCGQTSLFIKSANGCEQCWFSYMSVHLPYFVGSLQSEPALLFLVLPAGHSPPSVWCKSSPTRRGLAGVQSSGAPETHSQCHSEKHTEKTATELTDCYSSTGVGLFPPSLKRAIWGNCFNQVPSVSYRKPPSAVSQCSCSTV